MARNIFADDPVTTARAGLGAPQRLPFEAPPAPAAATAPTDPRQRAEGAAQRYKVPANVLLALEERGEDVEASGKRLSDLVAEGRTVEQALAMHTGDMASREAILNRAYDIADELYPEAPAPEPEKPSRAAEIAKTVLDPTGATRELIKGVRRGWHGSLEAAGTALGADEFAARQGEKADNPALAADTDSWRDVTNPVKAARYLTSLLGESAPEMGAVTAATIAGGVTGGPPGAIAAAVGTSSLFHAGRNIERQEQENGGEVQSYARAYGFALVQGGLDAIVPGKVTGFTQRAAGAAAKRSAGRNIAADTATEAATETAQQLIEIGQADPELLRVLVDPQTPEEVAKSDAMLEELVESAIGGAAMGGVLSAAGETVRRGVEPGVDTPPALPGPNTGGSIIPPAPDRGPQPIDVTTRGTMEIAPGTRGAPRGPLETALEGAPPPESVMPAEEPEPRFPDQKPGAEVQIADPDGRLFTAVVMGESETGIRVRIGGEEFELTAAEFDEARDSAVTIAEARKQAAKGKPSNVQNPHTAQPEGKLSEQAMAGVRPPEEPAPALPTTIEDTEAAIATIRAKARPENGGLGPREGQMLVKLRKHLETLIEEEGLYDAPKAETPTVETIDAGKVEIIEPEKVRPEIVTGKGGQPFPDRETARRELEAQGKNPEGFRLLPGPKGGILALPKPENGTAATSGTRGGGNDRGGKASILDTGAAVGTEAKAPAEPKGSTVASENPAPKREPAAPMKPAAEREQPDMLGGQTVPEEKLAADERRKRAWGKVSGMIRGGYIADVDEEIEGFRVKGTGPRGIRVTTADGQQVANIDVRDPEATISKLNRVIRNAKVDLEVNPSRVVGNLSHQVDTSKSTASESERAPASSAPVKPDVVTKPADVVTKDEPPKAEGMVRVYHGSDGDSPRSTWFSTDRRYAESYYGEGTNVFYTDLPRDHPKLNNEDYPEQSLEAGFTFSGSLDDRSVADFKPLAAAEPVASKVNAPDPNPTEAQKEAGNYRMAHVTFQGLDITIETAKGQERRGKAADGTEWSVTMPADYGYLKRTEGADGDHVDVYVGPNAESDVVVIVDQIDLATGKFDETKVILGASSAQKARKIYEAGFSDGKGAARIGGIKKMTVAEFKEWLAGDTSKPVAMKDAGEQQAPLSPKKAPEKATTDAGGTVDYPGFEPLRPGYTRTMVRGYPSTTQTRVTEDGYVITREPSKTTVFDPQGRGFFAGQPDVPESKLEALMTEARKPEQGGRRASTKPAAAPKPAQNMSENMPASEKTEETGAKTARKPSVREEVLKGHAPDSATPPDGWGAQNKLVSQERRAELAAKLKAKLKGQLNSGIDPEILAIGAELMVFHIEAGARRFGDAIAAVAGDLGTTPDKLTRYARAWYNGARDMLEDSEQSIEGMDDANAVRAALTTLKAGQVSPTGATPEDAPSSTVETPEARDDDGDLVQGGERQAGGELAGGERAGDAADPSLAADQPEDGGASRSGRRPRGGRARSDRPDARGGEGLQEGGDAADGRPGAGGDGLADAGAGKRDAPRPRARANYLIADPEAIVGGTPMVRFRRNQAAIEAFNDITADGREPTAEELDALAGYIGWGSFGQELFQGSWDRPKPKQGWEERDAWLREHLGEEAWKSAQASIINAHYTDPPTVQTMWAIAEKLGFKGGRVLEPSMGIGNFFGLMPPHLASKSTLTGIELDRTTGGIAKLLYPEANITIRGYEKSQTPDGFYDLVIGNWPFAAQGPVTRRYAKLNPSLHDFFFVKALDQTRPGGIVMGITSAGTMDKQGSVVRRHLAANAELVGVFRLPTGAFEKYAGTSVVTDIIILKKRETPLLDVSGEGWIEAREMKTPAGPEIRVNEFFHAHPENVLGTLNFGSGTTYGRAAMIVDRPADLMDRLTALPERVPEGAMTPVVRGREERFLANNEQDRTGSVVIADGGLWVAQGEQLAPLEDFAKYAVKDAAKTKAREDAIRGLVQIRKAYGATIDAERDAAPDTEEKRARLNELYQRFRKRHGPIGDSDALSILKKARDPNAAMLEALERRDGTPSAVLTEPLVRSKATLENPSIADAFVVVRNESSTLDLDRVAELAKVDREAVVKELLGRKAIYRMPGGDFEIADLFLSGNVRKRLRAPVDTKVNVDGQARVVTGHRWGPDSYFVLTDEGDVDYREARGPDGGRLYDDVEWKEPPVAAERAKDEQAPDGAKARRPELAIDYAAHADRFVTGDQVADPLLLANVRSIFARRLARLGLDGAVTLRFAENFVRTDGGRINGWAFGNIIGLSLGLGTDTTHTFDHEAVHVLRDPDLWGRPFGLFTREEWRALVRAARADRAMVKRAKAAYPDLDAAGLVEEAIAEIYADWAAGKPLAYSEARGAMTRIRDFFAALGAALRGAKLETPEAVFNAIGRGDIGRRRNAKGQFVPVSQTHLGKRDAERAARRNGRAGNTQPGLVRMRHSRFAPTGTSEWVADQGRFASDILTDAMAGRPGLLSLVPGRALFTELGRNLLAAKTYQRMKERMDALRNDWHGRTDNVAQLWLSLRQGAEPDATWLSRIYGETIGLADPNLRRKKRAAREANQELMDLMHEATLIGVDPSKPLDLTGISPEFHADARENHDGLRARFVALPKAMQDLFRRVARDYDDMGDAFEAAVLENIKTAMEIGLKRAERAHRKEMQRIKDEGLTDLSKAAAIEEADAALARAKARAGWSLKARIGALRKEFESNRLKGPYFPLARFGSFWVTLRDQDGKVVSFSRFESAREQRREIAAATKEGRYRVEHGVLSETDGTLKGQVDPTFVAHVQELVGDHGGDPGLMDAIWQRWLETLPDQSIRTSRIHRKGRKGYAKDALRAYTSHLFHGAHQLARLKYGLQMEEALNDADEEAARQDDPERAGLVVNEMRKRHAFTMEPKGGKAATAITSIAFLWFLGITPAAAIVNISQTTVIGIPLLKAAFPGSSVGTVGREILRASKAFATGKGQAQYSAQLAPEERDAMREAYRRGTIDKTQAHELAGVAESGVEYSGVRERWMRRASFFFHHAERANREVTFLAAFRLARKNGIAYAEAIERAADLTWKTHFDYQNTARPRLMQNDTAKVLLIFRSYTLNVLWRLFRDMHQAVKGETAENRREAKIQVTGITLSMMLHAGITGTWGYGLVTMLLGIFFPGGDDDVEEWLHHALIVEGDGLGVASWNFAAGAALKGIPGHVTRLSLSERIGMPNLWFRGSDRPLEGADAFNHWTGELLGPAAAIPLSFFRAAQYLGDGEWWRATESATPKFLRDAMRATRYVGEGVTTRNGDPILEEVNPYQALAQAVGFTPAQIAERYDANSRMKNKEQRITGDRSDLQREIGGFILKGETPPPAVLDKWRAWNEANPDYPITGATLSASVGGRRRASQRNEFGMQLNPRLNDRIRGEAAPLIYN